MGKDFNTELRKSFESDWIKHTRRRKQLLREMGFSKDLDSAALAERLHEQTHVVDALIRNLVHKDEEIEKLKAHIVELESRKDRAQGQRMFQHKVGAQNYATVIQKASKNGTHPFEVLRVIATSR